MIRRIKQIPLVYKSKEDLKEVIILCKELGYSILHGLDDIESIKERIIAVCVDIEEKKVFQSNVTCMAAWCSCNGSLRKPLYAHELVKHYKNLLIDKDLTFYEELIKKASLDQSRPGGILLKVNKNSEESPNYSNEVINSISSSVNEEYLDFLFKCLKRNKN